MRAAQIDQYNQPLVINNVPDPPCPDDGVVIDVQACGVCRSDWHGWKGTHPLVKPGHIPGHEFAGLVCEVGSECNNFSVGDRVTAPFILACGKCHACAHTSATVCDTQRLIGFSTQGSFAQFLPISRADFNLVHLPQSISLVDAAGMGCRVTTAYRALFDRANLQPGEWLAIHGCGGVGLSAILLAKSIGARIIAVDINPEALVQAKNIGADHLLNPTDHDNVGEAIREISNGGAQVSLDALGITATFINSITGLAKLGRHIQVGYPLGPHATPTLPRMI